ncbi:DUF1566 domain-containing protein [Xanthomonas sacchari]|uniref:Lcl C-terminal domain-containing protein n=1 Tax=Xanthomonas sacchari TaxID=56458 RepID=UPI00225DF082|nr:DUF1566 domain-containing protein [Xanthomonas sacchari]UYK82288.1 DUF1566 domain-containing protein [Xanthomonas sacchari]
MTAAQQNRFTQTRDASGNLLTVIDSSTGLEWLAAPLQERMPQRDALAACAALDYAGHTDWALPSRPQLESLIDLKRYVPAIDTDAFPDFPAARFWTSDECAWSSASAWGVDFYDGNVSRSHRDGNGFALAVRRAGQ